MKWMLLALMTVVLAACSGESLSPERKACLEKASTEAERIECNKESAIEADKKAEDGIRDVERSRGLGDVYKRQPFDGGGLLETDYRCDVLRPSFSLLATKSIDDRVKP